MRKLILKQNVRAGGRLFELGSLYMDRVEVPIVHGMSYEVNNQIGYANDMRLDASTGEVTMELYFKPHYESIITDPETKALFDYTIMADRVEARGSAQLGNQTISKCRLMAVALVPISSMPKPIKKLAKG